MNIDEDKLQAFMGTVLGDMGGTATMAMVCIGDELGLYRAMDGAGATTADDLANSTGCHPRLVREWLDQQASANYVLYRPDDDTYQLPPEHAMALAQRDSPVFVAAGMLAFASMYQDLDRIVEVFQGDGGLAWGDHSPSLFRGTAEFFRPGYRTHLVAEWIPALGGVESRLEAGGRIADVGCGHGVSTVVMAEAYPRAELRGFDSHKPSIDAARRSAESAGVGERVAFQTATAKEFTGEFDLVCFFDCLHDMGDPVGIAEHTRGQLAEGGTVMLVEPYANDDKTTNHRLPTAKVFYGASAIVCTPNSLSQEVGRAMGTQSGEHGMRAVFEEAGYRHFRRATETPFNIVYEARP